MKKKLIAWGASPLLELYLSRNPDHGFAYCLDKSSALQGKDIEGVAIFSPDRLLQESREGAFIVITAMSSAAVQSIHAVLSEQGYRIGRDYADFSAFLKDNFRQRADGLSDGNSRKTIIPSPDHST